MSKWNNEHIKNKLNNHEFDFSEAAWEKMDDLLEQSNDSPPLFPFFNLKTIIFMITIITAIIFSLLLNQSPEKTQHITPQTTIKSTIQQDVNLSSQPETTEKAINNSIKYAPKFTENNPKSVNPTIPKPVINQPKRDTFFQYLENILLQHNNYFAPEKTYLHLDRTLFKPGEAIWFTIYVRDALTNFPSKKSDLVHVQFLAPNGNIVKELTLFTKNGVASGDIQLNDQVLGGEYKIKAYTTWQRNHPQLPKESVKTIQINKSVLPNLRMSLDFERKAYGAGDQVVANLELKTLENDLLKNHEYKIIATINGTNFINKLGKTNVLGKAKVTFELPKTLTSSDGLLNILIIHNGQTESISRSIPIVFNEIDLQFLPESGNFLANNENTIAFKALNQHGKPADVKGDIFDNNGQKVTSFSSYHQGMGAVRFKAEIGKIYTAKINTPKDISTIYNLPNPTDEGAILHLKKQDEKYLYLEISASSKKKLHLSAQINGKIKAVKAFKVKKDKVKTIRLSKAKMPIGIATLTLFEGKQPIAERLTFVQPQQQLDIKITTDKEKYLPREKVNLSINVKNHKGNPVEGQFSLAVVDDKLLSFADNKQGHILSYFLLESELKGKVEEPNFYFENPEKHPEKDQLLALDYLMLTQGWRKVNWHQNQPTFAVLHHSSERTIIDGQIFDEHSNPIGGIEVVLQNTDYKTITSKNGYYKFKNIQLKNDNKLIISATVKEILLNKVAHKYGTYNLIVPPKLYETKYIDSNQSTSKSIKGNVLDLETQEELIACTAALYPRGSRSLITGAYSNLRGDFEIKNIDAGLYDLVIKYVGYNDLIIPITHKKQQTTIVNVKMSEDFKSLNELVVIGYDNQKKSNVTGAITTITATDIAKLPNKSISGIIAQTAGASSTNIASYQWDTKKTEQINIRGSRSNSSTIYIDGVKIQGNSIIGNDQNDVKPTTPGDVNGAIISITTKGNEKFRPAQNKIGLSSNASIIDSKTILIPAEYRTVTRRVVATPATTRTVDIPAEYKTVTKRIVSAPATIQTVDIPAEYKTIQKQILVKGSTKNEPAQFKTISEQVMIKAASTRINVLPAEYETVTERVMIKEPTTRIEVVPAQYNTATEEVLIKPAQRIQIPSTVISNSKNKQKVIVEMPEYETVTERIMTKAASTRIEVVPAQYSTATDNVLAKAESKKLITVPAEYENVTETIEVSPATTVWVKRKANRNCLSADPNDCQVWCLVEVPARYENITKTVLKTPATTKEVIIPAEYQTVTKRVVSKPATTRTIEVAAEYKTITKRVRKKAGKASLVEIAKGYENASDAELLSYQKAMNFKNGFYNGRAFYSPKYEASEPPFQVNARTDFRSTIFWQPFLTTDKNGQASVSFYNSDEISTFKAVIEGFGNQGEIGRGKATFYTQLPFGMRMKAPAILLMGDEVRLPLTLINNTADKVTGKLFIQTPKAFVASAKIPTKITLAPNEKRTIFLGYKVQNRGEHGLLRVSFNAKGLHDSFEQPIQILKKGFPAKEVLTGDKLKTTHNINIQAPIDSSIDGRITVYPSALGDVAESAKRMLRQPNGCFEQTSSSNYPNILVLNYLKSTNTIQPETEKRALDFLDRGYKRLLGFEVAGGGFDWYGKPDSHEGLTAYGLMEFVDMKSVYPVEEALIERTVNWLLSRRDNKGSWQRHRKSRFGGNNTKVGDAYIVWAMCEAGYGSQIKLEIEKSYQDALATTDPYIIALLANALFEINDNRAINLVKNLYKFQEENGQWKGQSTSITNSSGRYLHIETTALVTLAMMKAQKRSESGSINKRIKRAINFIAKSKTRYGFGSTQGTVLSMKALLEYAKINTDKPQNITIEVYVNNKKIRETNISSDQNKALIIGGLSEHLKAGNQEVKVVMKGSKEALRHDVMVNYTTLSPKNKEKTPFNFTTKLNINKVKMGETVRLTTIIENKASKKIPNPMAIVGIPSGLSLQLWQLKEMQERNVFDYYEIMDGYIVFHYRGMEGNATKTIHLDLKADIPGTYESPASSGFLYYSPNKTWAAPVKIEIQ